MFPSYLVVAVLPHVAGVPTNAVFDEPAGIGQVADQSFTLKWQDRDDDLTGRFSMYFQPTNVPPGVPFDHLSGTPIANGQEMPIQNPDETLVWDTRSVPSGSYFVYALTLEDDPALGTTYGISDGVITIQHAGEPLHPAVIVTDPGVVSPPTGDAYAIRWEASGAGPLVATIRTREKISDDPFADVAVDVPMEQAAGKQTGCYVWDLGVLPAGYYEVQVEVRDPDGHVHKAYAVTDITLLRDPNPTDAGPRVSCDPAGVDEPDAGPPDAGAPGENQGEAGCGCRTGGERTSGAGGALAALAALALLTVRRQRRR